jgi:hypothetical protein
MTNCFAKKKLISRLIDGDLPSDESDRIKAHCIECIKCSSVYKGYLKTQRIVNECFSDEPVLNEVILKPGQIPRGLLSRVPTFSTFFPVGAFVTFAIVLLMFLAGPFSIKRTVPLLIENSASIMNTPLGSLAYYEEHDGTTVQSQFTKLSSGPSDAFDNSTNAELQYPSYSSPLFYDADVDGNNYFQSASSAGN